MKRRFLVLLIVILIVISCKEKTMDIAKIESFKDSNIENSKPYKSRNDTIIEFTFRGDYTSKVEIRFPKDSIKANLLLLHGWNLPASDWYEKTDICSLALDNGYCIILPDLSLCNYPLEIYPETIDKYRKYPDLPWIMDTLIGELQDSFSILKPNQTNFVAGISTGGRGATLLAFYMPEIFDACASISGDFDITKMKNEFLYRAWFGKYEDFPERWKNECFAYRTKEYSVPTYIAHGKIDSISPCEQSISLFDSLKINRPELSIKANFPDSANHNYQFWSSESNNIMVFFQNFI